MLFTGKNNREYESPILIIRDELGIKMTDLCKECNCHSSQIYDLAYGRTWPVYIHTGKLKPYVEKICDVLGVTVDELFPLFFCKLRPKPYPNEELYLSEYTLRVANDPYSLCVEKDFVRQLGKNWKRLPKRTKKILSLYFYDELSLREIGVVFCLTSERVRNIIGQGLARLRVHTRTLGKEWREL